MKKLNYRWIICLMGMLMVFINIGVVANGFSVFLPYVIQEHGFTYAQGSNLITIRCLFSLVAMFVVNLYYKRFSLRTGTALATFLTFLGFIAYASADTYFVFCLGAALSGLAFSFGAMIAVSLLMKNWFTENTATAIGICSAGSGIATIVLPPVTAILIERFSLSTAFGMESAFFLVCSIVMFIVVRDHPVQDAAVNAAADALQDASDEETVQSDTESCSKTSTPDASFNTAIPVPVWILTFSASLLVGMIANTGVTHLAALYSADGYRAMTAALFVSIMGIVLTIGKIAYGSMSDRFGGLKATVFFAFVLIIGHILCILTYTQNIAIGICSAVLAGFGWPIGTIGPSIWAGDLSGPKEYAKALQVFQLGYSAGSLVFASVPGIMADHSGGTYNSAYAVMGAMLVVFTVIIIVSYRIRRQPCRIIAKVY